AYMTAFGIVAVVAFLAAMVEPALTYTRDEWIVNMPGLDISRGWRISAIPFGIVAMLCIVLAYAWRSTGWRQLLVAAVVVGGIALACWGLMPVLRTLGMWNLVIFMLCF